MMWHVSNYALRCVLEREHPQFAATMPHINTCIDISKLDKHFLEAQIHAMKVFAHIQKRERGRENYIYSDLFPDRILKQCHHCS
jgi:hypothetical protein